MVLRGTSRYTFRNMQNMMMINTARKHGACAKFCGSGGAIVILFPVIDKEEPMLNHERVCALQEELEAHGCVFVKVIPNAHSKGDVLRCL